jgi:outer membrane cobalamin receptor
MKRALFPLIPLFILGSVLVVAAGCAHQNSQVQNRENNNEEYLTGSYMPQSVDRNGPVTNGKNDVRVIDRSDIDRSGGANVQQSLRQLGVTH